MVRQSQEFLDALRLAPGCGRRSVYIGPFVAGCIAMMLAGWAASAATIATLLRTPDA